MKNSRLLRYFEEYINRENNFLIPDNYQENRKNKIVDRTSSTNIGLSFIAIMTAYDFGFIEKQKCYDLIVNILNIFFKDCFNVLFLEILLIN